MECFDWNVDKNEDLRTRRGITSEEVVFAIMHGGLLDALAHPNRSKYPHQKVLIVNIEDYAYIVPFVESEHGIFLKTVIPSRKMTRRYLEGKPQ